MVTESSPHRGSSEATIAAARQMYDHARLGQRDFEEGGERTISGLYAAITSGRSVTFVLQNLRSRVDDFDDFYAPIQEMLRGDPVSKWFVTVRNSIEKQGTAGTWGTVAYVTRIDVAEIWDAAPPGTEDAFIGDSLGRSGYRVRLADGSLQTVFFTPPGGAVQSSLIFEGAPGGRAMADLLQDWLGTLDRVLRMAEERYLAVE